MSIALQGIDSKIKSTTAKIFIRSTHPLLRLANALDWTAIANLAMPDLKATTRKGCWMLGRKLFLRVHLGVYVLQSLLKETDRGIEQRINDTPVLQLFCGSSWITRRQAPDHTKIADFRNRLSPETHQKIGARVVQTARELGFADPSWMDLDSTVQEANISYPSDASLLKKFAEKGHYVLEHLKERAFKGTKDLTINIEKIRKTAQAYFFQKKNTAQEVRWQAFNAYERLVERQLKPFLKYCLTLSENRIKQLPWEIQHHLKQLKISGFKYLADVRYFMRHHRPKTGKLLSFHASEMAFISKGKPAKPFELGRVFQLGRIGGNFLIAFTNTSIRMEDKKSLVAVIEEHQQIFGTDTLQEVGTDKGYYSKANIRALRRSSINSDGIQRPANAKEQPSASRIKELRDRRAGIEPLIGHAKHFGLRKSRMKSDRATLASGYRSVMGFNLNQLIRHMAG